MLELMGEQRLERRTASGALARTAVGPMDTRPRDWHGAWRQVARKLGVVGAMRDAAEDYGVDVELEAER